MVDRAGLENRKAERPREFESHPLRCLTARRSRASSARDHGGSENEEKNFSLFPGFSSAGRRGRRKFEAPLQAEIASTGCYVHVNLVRWQTLFG